MERSTGGVSPALGSQQPHRAKVAWGRLFPSTSLHAGWRDALKMEKMTQKVDLGCELSKPRWGGEAVKRNRQGKEKPRRASGTPSTGFSSTSRAAPRGQAQK